MRVRGMYVKERTTGHRRVERKSITGESEGTNDADPRWFNHVLKSDDDDDAERTRKRPADSRTWATRLR